MRQMKERTFSSRPLNTHLTPPWAAEMGNHITSLLGPATEDANDSSSSSASRDTLSLQVMDTSPLFLEKRRGTPPQEPAPRMPSPREKHTQTGRFAEPTLRGRSRGDEAPAHSLPTVLSASQLLDHRPRTSHCFKKQALCPHFRMIKPALPDSRGPKEHFLCKATEQLLSPCGALRPDSVSAWVQPLGGVSRPAGISTCACCWCPGTRLSGSPDGVAAACLH